MYNTIMGIFIGLFIVSCGGKHDPVEGHFLVVSEFQESDGECGPTNKDIGFKDVSDWKIKKEGNLYTIMPLSNTEPPMVFSTSKDGYAFDGVLDNLSVGYCVWSFSWHTELDYGDNFFGGLHTNILSVKVNSNIPDAVCDEKMCRETWNLEGRLQ